MEDCTQEPMWPACIYLARRLGGRGLQDIAETNESEDRSLIGSIWNNDDPLLAVVKADEMYQQKSKVPNMEEEFNARTAAERDTEASTMDNMSDRLKK